MEDRSEGRSRLSRIHEFHWPRSLSMVCAVVLFVYHFMTPAPSLALTNGQAVHSSQYGLQQPRLNADTAHLPSLISASSPFTHHCGFATCSVYLSRSFT